MRLRRDLRRFTDDEVRSIRAQWREGATVAQISKDCNGNPWLVTKALRGVTYSDVPGWVTSAEWEDRYGHS